MSISAKVEVLNIVFNCGLTDNNIKLNKAEVGSQRARKVQIPNKEELIEVIKKEAENTFLSWDLMTRVTAHSYNVSKKELLNLLEEESKGK